MSATMLEIQKFDGETSGRHIILLKDNVDKVAHLSLVNRRRGATVTHNWNIINAYAGNFDTETLVVLRSSADVQTISEDGKVSAKPVSEETKVSTKPVSEETKVAKVNTKDASEDDIVTQRDAPWGVARLSSSFKLTPTVSGKWNYQYKRAGGKGVDVYVVDAGIYIDHTDFAGRARWGATFGGYADADGSGRGTHYAATIAGTRWGVAKEASLIAVKVLSDNGTGYVSDAVSGLNWVSGQVAASGTPSIVFIGANANGPSKIFDDAVVALFEQHIHVTVAAGNDATDAINGSPSRVAVVNTIGATDIMDSKTGWSNYGAIVDLYAPGQTIQSAGLGPWGFADFSGTGSAAAHVAGLIAYLISIDDGDHPPSPSEISERLKDLAFKGVLSNIPEGTANLLAHNGLYTEDVETSV